MAKDIFQQQGLAYAKYADDSFSWKNIELPCLKRHLTKHLKPSSNIIEAGSGSGRIIDYLKLNSIKEKNITGIDSNKELITLTKNKYPQAKFIQANICDRHLRPKKSDVIIASMVLHFLNDKELDKALYNFNQWTHKGGFLFFVVAHPLRFISRDLKQYFNTGWRNEKTPWNTKLPFWQRTIADYVNQTISADYNILVIDEPHLSARKKFNSEQAKYAQLPTRLAVLAQKK